MSYILYALGGLLCVSIFLNIFLCYRVKVLSNQLREVDQRVELTQEELAHIRNRLERMKKNI